LAVNSRKLQSAAPHSAAVRGRAKGPRADTEPRGTRLPAPQIDTGGLANETLRERVHARLRDDILANRILPGVELQEVALAKSLGVSRGPIREALNRLEAEGLITIRPRRGAMVTGLSKAAFLDSYRVREALEMLAVRLATPKATDAEIEHLRGLLKTMTDQFEDEDVAAFFETNAAFHEAFVEMSGNEKLLQLYRPLTREMSRYRGWSLRLRGSPRGSIAEHREIVRAVAARDAERAVRLMSKHIRVPQRRLEAMAAEEVVTIALGAP